jgi:hypothetical protein
LEVKRAIQNQWFEGVVDRIGTIFLMTGPMVWGALHQYWTDRPTNGEILAVLALAWHVQFKVSALFTLIKARFESDAAASLFLTRPLTSA